MYTTMRIKQRINLLLMAAALAIPVSQAQGSDDKAIPRYKVVAGISGKLSVESDNIADNLVAEWFDRFAVFYPEVDSELENSGLSASSYALAETTTTLAVLAHPMSGVELAAFEKKHGYYPKGIKTGHGAVVIYVNNANPIKNITLAQIDAVYSVNRRCGEAKPIRTWGQLGVKGEQKKRKIELIGVREDSSASELLRDFVLCGGDYRSDMQQLASSSAVQALIATEVNALGFADLNEVTAGVKTLAVGPTLKGPFVAPDADSVRRIDYPLTHDIYIYLNLPHGRKLLPVEREFIKMVLSHTGQQALKEMGNLPLSVDEIRLQRRLIDQAQWSGATSE
jgi:phosphate transport system substrate-binding protein